MKLKVKQYPKLVFQKSNMILRLLCCALVLSSISYFGYWLSAVRSGAYVYFSYETTPSGVLAMLRYADDVIFVALGVVLWSRVIHKKVIYFTIAGLAWGGYLS